MKIKYAPVLIFLLLIFSYYPITDSASEGNKEWYKEVQVYDMVALPPDNIQSFHITVNGLWNGFFADNLTSPFAFGRHIESLFSGRNYTSDEEFVKTMHDEGVLVPATILTTQGHRSFQRDKLEEWACRSVDGKLCYWDYEADSYWMNALNDGFIEWCIEHGKKAIDAGADLIVLDEIQGSSFIPMYQWASQYIDWLDAPGFSNVTINKFRQFLAEKYTDEELKNIFNIDNISSYDLKSRIAKTMYLTYQDRIKADRLNVDYFQFLDEGNFMAKKYLIEELRKYAREKDKNIVIAANSYALGTPRGAGYWSKGLLFADLLDFFAFENKYSALSDEGLPLPPRAKWVAWEKLAYASTKAPSAILLGANEAAYIARDSTHSYKNYLAILCAEAYANRAAFVNWYVRIWGKASDWEGCASIYRFVLNHDEIYEGKISSPVSILYLYGEGMRNKSDSYLGLAQMLAELNVPYEVVFDGDGTYIKENLTVEKLSPYKLVFIPNVINITQNQKYVIFDYVKNGGKAVVFDARELGFNDSEGNVSYGKGMFIFMHDIAYDYFHSYDDGLRKKMEEVVKENVEIPLTIENGERKIVAYPYLQEDKNRLIIHLVNYDYRKWGDEIVNKRNINMSIRKPDFRVKSCYAISPDFDENTSISFHEDDKYINITIPLLRTYDVVILNNKEENLSVKITRPQNAIYIFDKEILPASKPIIIGKITIKAEATPNNMIQKIEFYVDNMLKFTDDTPPYSWRWNEFAIGEHEIKVAAYYNGNKVEDKIDIFIFNLE